MDSPDLNQLFVYLHIDTLVKYLNGQSIGGTLYSFSVLFSLCTLPFIFAVRKKRTKRNLFYIIFSLQILSFLFLPQCLSLCYAGFNEGYYELKLSGFLALFLTCIINISGAYLCMSAFKKYFILERFIVLIYILAFANFVFTLKTD
jgi:hypothetical protein